MWRFVVPWLLVVLDVQSTFCQIHLYLKTKKYKNININNLKINIYSKLPYHSKPQRQPPRLPHFPYWHRLWALQWWCCFHWQKYSSLQPGWRTWAAAICLALGLPPVVSGSRSETNGYHSLKLLPIGTGSDLLLLVRTQKCSGKRTTQINIGTFISSENNSGVSAKVWKIFRS